MKEHRSDAKQAKGEHEGEGSAVPLDPRCGGFAIAPHKRAGREADLTNSSEACFGRDQLAGIVPSLPAW